MNPASYSLIRSSLLAAIASLPAAGLFAQSMFLGSASGQQWGTAANWSAGVPNVVGAVATLSPSGGVSNIVINNPGLGYTTAPAGATAGLTLTGGTSTVTASATAI